MLPAHAGNLAALKPPLFHLLVRKIELVKKKNNLTVLKIKLIVIKINSIVTDKTCSIIYDCNTNRLICATFNSVVSKIDSVEKKLYYL